VVGFEGLHENLTNLINGIIAENNCGCLASSKTIQL